MAGIFLSYSRLDADVARRVRDGLTRLGVECWWDQEMPGVVWQSELERQVKSMAGLVVLWTPSSVNSQFVKAEARLALRENKLINALVGLPEPPWPFDGINGLPLDGWTGREPHNGWSRLVQTIEDSLAAAGTIQAGALTSALAAREQEVRGKHKAAIDSEEAYRDAQAVDAEAAATAAEARSEATKAEEQLARMIEMRASANIIRAAQADFDHAHGAAEEAGIAEKKAASGLATASRSVARARTAYSALFEETGGSLSSDARPESALAESGAAEVVGGEEQSPPPASESLGSVSQQSPAPEPTRPPLRRTAAAADPTKPTRQGPGIGIPLVAAGLIIVALVAAVGLSLHRASPDNVSADTADSLGPMAAASQASTATASDSAASSAVDTATADDNGYAAYQKNDFATALRWYLIAANQGDAEAEDFVGAIYGDGGNGVRRSYAAAATWYRKAAEQGNADAQANLGWLYERACKQRSPGTRKALPRETLSPRINSATSMQRARAAL